MNAAAQCPQLPPELWEHIHSFMPLGRRLQACRVSSGFRALVDRGTARVHLATIGVDDDNGTMVRLSVNGALVKSVPLRDGWRAIRAVVLKGYNSQLNARVLKYQFYRNLVAAR